MPPDQDHHYVPRFYIRKWVSQSDGKVQYFRWANGKIVSSRISPGSTAYERNLYSLQNVPSEERQAIETFFSIKIDNPASIVLNKILHTGVDNLSNEEKVTWVRFIVSLRYRGPEGVQKAKEEGKNILENSLVESQLEYEALRGPDDPTSFVEFCKVNTPGALSNTGIKALSQWLYGTKFIHLFLKMHWWVADVSGEDIDLFTSDHPCIFTRGLGDLQCIISLPLSPNLVFFAANDPNNINKIKRPSKRKLIRHVHKSMLIQQNVKMIYSTSDRHAQFIRNHLKKNNASF